MSQYLWVKASPRRLSDLDLSHKAAEVRCEVKGVRYKV